MWVIIKIIKGYHNKSTPENKLTNQDLKAFANGKTNRIVIEIFVFRYEVNPLNRFVRSYTSSIDVTLWRCNMHLYPAKLDAWVSF